MKKIKELREAKGVRQIDMAAHFHVVQSTIVSWESEKKFPPCRLMPAIAEYLGCKIEDLYERGRT